MKKYMGIMLVIVVLGLAAFNAHAAAVEANVVTSQNVGFHFCIEGDCPPARQ